MDIPALLANLVAMKKFGTRLTYANVVSSLALFLVLSGGAAYAAKKIGSHELRGGAVTTAKIKRSAVTRSKIKAGAISTAKIANGAVTNARLASGSVSLEKLAPGFVAPTAEKLSHAARISAGGIVQAGSVGISQANVTHPSEGFYCFSGLNPAPVGGVATIDYGDSGEEGLMIQLAIGQGLVCPPSTQAFIDPRKPNKAFGKTDAADAGFFVILY